MTRNIPDEAEREHLYRLMEGAKGSAWAVEVLRAAAEFADVAQPWRLTVEGLHRIAGHGLVAAGKMVAEEEPKLGPITVWRPDGTTEARKARSFERFAIPVWWHANVGVLLDGDGDVPIGSVLEGVCR